MKKLGDRIRYQRNLSSLKRKELCEKCRIPLSTLAAYENNIRTPSINTICNIAKILKINPIELIPQFDNYTTYTSDVRFQELFTKWSKLKDSEQLRILAAVTQALERTKL